MCALLLSLRLIFSLLVNFVLHSTFIVSVKNNSHHSVRKPTPLEKRVGALKSGIKMKAISHNYNQFKSNNMIGNGTKSIKSHFFLEMAVD